MHAHEALMIPLFALLIPIIVVPTAMVLRFVRQSREWSHRERMRALELGLPTPGSLAWPALVAIALGMGVPVGSFFFTWLALESRHVHEEFLFMPMIVSVVSLVVSYRLATRTLVTAPDAQQTQARHANGKPYASDPDEFDVVSRRGRA